MSFVRFGCPQPIYKYILSRLSKKVNKINNYVSNPINYKDINNPFSSTIPKTYVWIEEEKKN